MTQAQCETPCPWAISSISAGVAIYGLANPDVFRLMIETVAIRSGPYQLALNELARGLEKPFHPGASGF